MTKGRKKVSPSAKQLGLPKDEAPAAGPVTVLGMTFADDDARRVWFRDQLRTKLHDPAFRAQPGVPRGEVEAIVAMSDPPWYTACPNPWVGEFIAAYGSAYDPAVPYRRDPFAVDVVEKKTGLLYQAHGYHTKVPYLAILPFVLHYTKPGDVMLDGFCGSGMAGVAAQWCADPDPKFRDAVAKRFKAEDWDAPEWGARHAVLNDLSPAATFIAANYNVPFDVHTFEVAARALLDEVDAEIGWMYETKHPDGKVGASRTPCGARCSSAGRARGRSCSPRRPSTTTRSACGRASLARTATPRSRGRTSTASTTPASTRPPRSRSEHYGAARS